MSNLPNSPTVTPGTPSSPTNPPRSFFPRPSLSCFGRGGPFFALTQPQPPSKKKGLTGEHGSIPRRAVRGGDPNGMDSGRSIPGAPAVLRGTGRAGKSRAARSAVPHCISAEAPRLGVQGHFRASCRAVSIDAPGAFSLGPLQRHRLGRRSRHGPSGPRRKCGVRRREPLCGATGVYQIKGAPAASRAVGNKREWGAGSTSPWEGKSAAFGRIKRDGGAESTPLGGGKKCGLWPHKKVRPRLRREMISAWKRCFKRCGRAAQIKKAPFWAPSVRKGLQ